jgi:hypothetical protein
VHLLLHLIDQGDGGDRVDLVSGYQIWRSFPRGPVGDGLGEGRRRY